MFQASCSHICRAKKVIYLTEEPYQIAKRKEEERIKYFLKRHENYINKNNLLSSYDLREDVFIQNQEIDADAIICQEN